LSSGRCTVRMSAKLGKAVRTCSSHSASRCLGQPRWRNGRNGSHEYTAPPAPCRWTAVWQLRRSENACASAEGGLGGGQTCVPPPRGRWGRRDPSARAASRQTSVPPARGRGRRCGFASLRLAMAWNASRRTRRPSFPARKRAEKPRQRHERTRASALLRSTTFRLTFGPRLLRLRLRKGNRRIQAVSSVHVGPIAFTRRGELDVYCHLHHMALPKSRNGDARAGSGTGPLLLIRVVNSGVCHHPLIRPPPTMPTAYPMVPKASIVEAALRAR
jgi:hypothetical protein